MPGAEGCEAITGERTSVLFVTVKVAIAKDGATVFRFERLTVWQKAVDLFELVDG